RGVGGYRDAAWREVAADHGAAGAGPVPAAGQRRSRYRLNVTRGVRGASAARPPGCSSGIGVAALVALEVSALGQGCLSLLHRQLQSPQALAPLAAELPVRQPHDLAAGGHYLDQAEVPGNPLERVRLVAHLFPLPLPTVCIEPL